LISFQDAQFSFGLTNLKPMCVHRRQGKVMNRGFLVAAIALAATVTIGAQSTPPARPQAGSTAAAAMPSTGSIVGTAWKGETTPYPQARIRLRNVQNGRGVARTDSDSTGRFRFFEVQPGAYVVELLSEQDKVLAVGDLFGVVTGAEATTLVRLNLKTTWIGGFFGNAAAAAISAASTLGVTAVGSNGRPVSPQ
jgi:hypothetical protein